MKITANSGYVFRRIHDGLIFGNEIFLGFDFSTGVKREDKEEYYEQIPFVQDLESKEDIDNIYQILNNKNLLS